MEKGVKESNIKIGKTKNLIFYIVMMIFPIAQFLIFYAYVNVNSILLAFQKMSYSENGLSINIEYTFENIKNAFYLLTSDKTVSSAIGRSIYAWFLGFIIGTPLALFFSYYIYKKLPFSNTFRVILFLPSIISSIVMVMMFQYFVDRAVPEILGYLFGDNIDQNMINDGLSSYEGTRFFIVMFYNIWIGFGTTVLLYSNGMSGISEEIVEASHLEGAKGLTEIIYITLPGVFPTISTFIITGVAGIFTNQLNLFSFYGEGAVSDVQTIGYYLYSNILHVTVSEYSKYSAMGILLTLVAVPMTLLVKILLEKFGPSEN